MPRTVDEGFRDFLKKLTPLEGESEAAKNHRASIEACLKNNFGLRRFFRSGSFGNGTSISGYSDVDYFASIPSANLYKSSNYSLRKVRDALANRFPNTGVRVSCPAITVPFGIAGKEATEVVPAYYIKKDNNGYYIYGIPNCRDGWMRSSPDAHNAYVRYYNGKLGNKLKPLIRFIKAWKYFRNVPISSFYLELRVTRYAQNESSIIYSIDIVRILRQLYNANLAAMQDPMGISGLIAPCATENLRTDALSKLSTALTRAVKARTAEEEGKINDAFYWWNLLYDGKFPGYYY